MTPQASSNYDWISLNNTAVGIYGPFVLAGGVYAIVVVMGSTSTVDVAILGPDGSTKVDIVSQFTGNTATTAYTTADMPPGSYYITIGTAAASVAVLRVRGP